MKKLTACLILIMTACGAPETAPKELEQPQNAPEQHAPSSPAAAPASVPSDQLALYESGSRIRMKVGKTADGARAFLGWHDNAKNVDCVFEFAEDGTTRCMPNIGQTATVDQFYSDAACSLALAYSYDNGCGTAPQFASKSVSMCPAGSAFFPIESEFRTTAYIKSGASCVAATAAPTVRFWNVGARIVSSDWVEQTTSIE